jgi:hypothetical protein
MDGRLHPGVDRADFVSVRSVHVQNARQENIKLIHPYPYCTAQQALYEITVVYTDTKFAHALTSVLHRKAAARVSKEPPIHAVTVD